MNGGDGCTMSMFLISLNCTPQNDENSKIVCYVYFTIIKYESEQRQTYRR